MSDVKLQSQVQFAVRSTQLQGAEVRDNCDPGVTRPFVEHFAAQDTNAEVATLCARSLARPALAGPLEEQVTDTLKLSDGVAQRAALVASGYVVAGPGLGMGLVLAGRAVNRLVHEQFSGQPTADAVQVGANHRFVEALRDAGDVAATVALQVSSLPAAAAVATCLFDVAAPDREVPTEYLATVGGRAIDTVYGHEGAGSAEKVELATAFIQALAKDSPHAQVVSELMEGAKHERHKAILGRCALAAFESTSPGISTEQFLAQVGLQISRDPGIRASACDLHPETYATSVPVPETDKQLRAAASIAGWLAQHGSENVREMASMTAGTSSKDKKTLLDGPYQTLFDTVAHTS